MEDALMVGGSSLGETGFEPNLRSTHATGRVVEGRSSMSDARLDALALADVLDEVDSGVLVCTAAGRVVLANDAGRRELLRGRPLAVDDDGWLLVPESGEQVLAQCRAALRAAVGLQRRQLLALDSGEHRLMVAVTPLGQQGRPWALMLLGRRKPAPELAIELLGKLCDLTHSERSVLVALVSGERVFALARRRGVKIATVRTQISALRAKLGAQRMEDLVRLAAGLPQVSGALRAPRLGMRDSGLAS